MAFACKAIHGHGETLWGGHWQIYISRDKRNGSEMAFNGRQLSWQSLTVCSCLVNLQILCIFGLEVAMSIRLCVCPLPMQFFLKPFFSPQITWSVGGLSLVNPPSLPYPHPYGGGGGGVGGREEGPFFSSPVFLSKKPLWRRQRQRHQRGGE